MNHSAILLRLCLILLIFGSTALAADTDKGQTTQGGTLPPEFKVVEKWRGVWDVRAMRRAPQPAAEVTYTETFEWVLDGRYLRSETSKKSDGGKSMSMLWYDVFTKTYRFMYFDALGLAVELPPPTWDERTQTMEWKASFFAPVSYAAIVTFTDPNTIRWKSLWKDWKGTAILDLEGTSFRRK